MAAEVETQVVVPEPQGEVNSDSREHSQHNEGKEGGSRLFNRKKNKKGDEKKSRKPPGTCTIKTSYTHFSLVVSIYDEKITSSQSSP